MNQVQIEAIAAIEKQQEGLKRNTVWMVGEQLKDICRREEGSAQLILEDLKSEDMSIAVLITPPCTGRNKSDNVVRWN